MGAEDGEDHEVVVLDEVTMVVGCPPHQVAPMILLLLRVVQTAEERVLVLIVPVILVPVWTFETTRVKATVRGVFTIAGAADVVVAEGSLAEDEVTGVAWRITIQAVAEEMDAEDETAVVFHKRRLGAGAISVVAVVETHAVIHEAILTNGEVTTDPKRQ